MQKYFEISGLLGVGVTIFDKTPKGTSVADFTHFKPLCVQIRSGVFSLDD